MQRFSSTVAILSALAACAGKVDGDDDGGGDDEPVPVVCEQTRIYTGFGGPLGDDRPKILAGSDRMRLKPFAALATEYQRVLGVDFPTSAYAGTFGKPPARWYEEPAASAATIYASFALAYDGCTRMTMSGGNFDLEPTAPLADRLCRDFARVAWQREANDDEAASCATYAVSQTAPSDPPRKRWAYACAAVLSSSDFLAY